MKYCDTCHATYPLEFTVCPKDQSPLREAEELVTGMVLRGKYEVLDKLGSGGMAVVYRAKHLTFGEIRAIKVVSSQLARDEKFLKRFRNEAIIARKLRHPNAVHIDDFDTTEDGRPFIVMDYVEGKSLRTVLHEDGPMPAQRAVRIARQVTAALDAAHKLGIVHRDIKPDNILIVPMPTKSEYGSDIAKVLDFGIATVREGGPIGSSGYTPTQTSMVVGTPQYISPEQAMGKPGSEIDGRADLYSLGCVLYEMLTGVPPFDSDTPIGVLLQHLQAQAKAPRERFPELNIPAKVSSLVMRALEKDPAHRFQSAAQMTQALSDPERWDIAVPASDLPAAKAASAAAGVPEFEVKPVQPPPPAPADDDEEDAAYGGKGRDRDSGVRFAGVDFEAMKRAKLPPELEPEPEEPPPPPPKKTIVVPPPPAVVAKPDAAAAAGPAPVGAAAAAASRPRPTPPPGPAPSVPAKPARPVTPSRADQTQTVYGDNMPKRPGAGPGLALPAWLPKAGYAAAGVVLLLILAVFAWNRIHSKAPAAPPAASASTRDDAAILADVKEALRDSPTLRRIPIDVSVQAGVVTLTGKTNKSNIPGFAQAVATSIPGVVQVNNQIDVVSGGAAYEPRTTGAAQRPSPGSATTTTSSPSRPAPFGGTTQEAPPVPGALPSATDESVGVQQMRIQQAIDMGNYRLAQKDYQGAARAFRRALALDPNNAAAKQGLRQAEQGH